MLRIGDVVEWESQAAGSTTKKIGTVIWILEKGDNPLWYARNNFGSHMRMFDGLSLPGNAFRAYLVEVTDGKKKPRLYMPYPVETSG